MKPLKLTFTAIAVALTTLTGCLTNGMIDKVLLAAAEEINKNCPIMVDSETRLDNCMAMPGKQLAYFYTMVNYGKDEMDIDIFSEHMTPTIINAVATNPQMEFLRSQKTTFSYQYKDKNGEFFWTLEVTPDMYAAPVASDAPAVPDAPETDSTAL